MYDLLEIQEDEEELFSTPEVIRQTGVSSRQIFYWVKVGCLNPTGANKGSGHPMVWDRDDIEQLLILKKLIDLGITLRKAKNLCQSKTARERFINELSTL